jgi:hypothetical protein
MEIHHQWIEAAFSPNPKTAIIDLIHQTEDLRKLSNLNEHKHHSSVLKPHKFYLKDHEKTFTFSFLHGLHYAESASECEVVLYSYELKEYLLEKLFEIYAQIGKHHVKERTPLVITIDDTFRTGKRKRNR